MHFNICIVAQNCFGRGQCPFLFGPEGEIEMRKIRLFYFDKTMVLDDLKLDVLRLMEEIPNNSKQPPGMYKTLSIMG